MQAFIEMDDEQVDAIIAQGLEDHILYTYSDTYLHEKDIEWHGKLKEALWVVFEYFAGEGKAEELKNFVVGEQNEI